MWSSWSVTRPQRTCPVRAGRDPPETQVDGIRTPSGRQKLTEASLTFQLTPRDELVSFRTAWLDSKILLLRLRWHRTCEQEACWVT